MLVIPYPQLYSLVGHVVFQLGDRVRIATGMSNECIVVKLE